MRGVVIRGMVMRGVVHERCGGIVTSILFHFISHTHTHHAGC